MRLLGFLALKELETRPMAAGFRHTCAIEADGELISGDNQDGQCAVPLDLGPDPSVPHERVASKHLEALYSCFRTALSSASKGGRPRPSERA